MKEAERPYWWPPDFLPDFEPEEEEQDVEPISDVKLCNYLPYAS